MAKRMRYPEVAPEGYAALSAFGHYVNTGSSLDAALLGLVYLRSSEINGCSFCISLHRAELQKHHEPATRIDAVAHWAESDAFTARERAALRWTEILTRLPDGPATDAEYEAVSAFFHGKDLVDLSFAIANINAWNRMGVAFQPQWRSRPADASAKEPEGNGGSAAATHGAPEHAAREGGDASTRGESPAAPEAAPMQSVVDDDGGKVATD